MIALSILLSTMLAAPQVCQIDSANYDLSTDGAVTMRLRQGPITENLASNLYLALGDTSRSVTYRFLFDRGNGMTTTALISTRLDPGRPGFKPPQPDGGSDRLFKDLEIFALDRDFAVIERLPTAGMPAPAYLFVPQLGAEIWYNGWSDRRRGIANGLFKLRDCAGDQPSISVRAKK